MARCLLTEGDGEGDLGRRHRDGDGELGKEHGEGARGTTATARARDGDVGDGEGSTATAMESTAAWRRRLVVGGDDGLAEGEGLIWRHPLAPVLATNRC